VLPTRNGRAARSVALRVGLDDLLEILELRSLVSSRARAPRWGDAWSLAREERVKVGPAIIRKMKQTGGKRIAGIDER
jgi:hypothetical protein